MVIHIDWLQVPLTKTMRRPAPRHIGVYFPSHAPHATIAVEKEGAEYVQFSTRPRLDLLPVSLGPTPMSLCRVGERLTRRQSVQVRTASQSGRSKRQEGSRDHDHHLVSK
jgi:hypothetical protein